MLVCIHADVLPKIGKMCRFCNMTFNDEKGVEQHRIFKTHVDKFNVTGQEEDKSFGSYEIILGKYAQGNAFSKHCIH